MKDQYLKCDAEGCDHVEYMDRITQEHVDKPCPKCGANLLTQADHDHFEMIQNLMAVVQATIPETGEEDKIPLDINVHDGKVRMKIGDDT